MSRSDAGEPGVDVIGVASCAKTPRAMPARTRAVGGFLQEQSEQVACRYTTDLVRSHAPLRRKRSTPETDWSGRSMGWGIT